MDWLFKLTVDPIRIDFYFEMCLTPLEEVFELDVIILLLWQLRPGSVIWMALLDLLDSDTLKVSFFDE